MFVSNFQPSKAIEATRVEPLSAKVTDGSKHSSLSQFVSNYYRKSSILQVRIGTIVAAIISISISMFVER
jgi:hypothetical protein